MKKISAIAVLVLVITTPIFANANPAPSTRQPLLVDCRSERCTKIEVPRERGGKPYRLEDVSDDYKLGLTPLQICLMVDTSTGVSPNLVSGSCWLICPQNRGDVYYDPLDLEIKTPDDIARTISRECNLHVGINHRRGAALTIPKETPPCERGPVACNSYVSDLERQVADLTARLAQDGPQGSTTPSVSPTVHKDTTVGPNISPDLPGKMHTQELPGQELASHVDYLTQKLADQRAYYEAVIADLETDFLIAGESSETYNVDIQACHEDGRHWDFTSGICVPLPTEMVYLGGNSPEAVPQPPPPQYVELDELTFLKRALDCETDFIHTGTFACASRNKVIGAITTRAQDAEDARDELEAELEAATFAYGAQEAVWSQREKKDEVQITALTAQVRRLRGLMRTYGIAAAAVLCSIVAFMALLLWRTRRETKEVYALLDATSAAVEFQEPAQEVDTRTFRLATYADLPQRVYMAAIASRGDGTPARGQNGTDERTLREEADDVIRLAVQAGMTEQPQPHSDDPAAHVRLALRWLYEWALKLKKDLEKVQTEPDPGTYVRRAEFDRLHSRVSQLEAVEAVLKSVTTHAAWYRLVLEARRGRDFKTFEFGKLQTAVRELLHAAGVPEEAPAQA